MSKNVVIIGGGVAAVSAVKSIREVDKEINIHIFQNEKYYPYYRIKLTKGLFDNLEEEKILLQKKEWYDLNNVKLYFNKEVLSIDTINNKINLNDGICFGYDKLLIVTGASNFKPPIDGINKENIFTIRELEDVKAIKDSVIDKKIILNIGGGIQGLEGAWAFSQQDKEVIVVEALERLMPRQLDKRASEILQNLIEKFNIKVLLNSKVEKIIGEGKAESIILNNGTRIKCDMIVYSVGIRANTKILENTEVNVARGIIVNNKMQTNVENIYAAGDVAELSGQIGGLWNVASEEGKVAGYNIAGKEASYSILTPVTMMNAFNTSLFSVGNIEESFDKTIVEDEKEGKVYKRLFFKDDKIIGAILVGDTKASMILKKAIENKTIISDMNSLKSFNDILAELKK